MSQRQDQSSSSENRINNVALVGAGGQLGKYILAALLEKGTFNVTAITREGSFKSPAAGVTAVAVDYDNFSTLVNALRGQDALVITMSGRAPPDQQLRLIKAAAEAGVPWVFPNEYGPDTANEELYRDFAFVPKKVEARDYVESLGVSKWIALVCSAWYEYCLSGTGIFGFDIAKKQVLFFDDGEQKTNTSTFPQTGRAVAALLSLPINPENGNEKATLSEYANRVAYVSSFTVSQRDMFKALKKVTHTSDADWSISSIPARQRFEESNERLMRGDHSAFFGLMSRGFYDDNAGFYEKTKGLDNEKLGLPQESLEEFTSKAVKMVEEGYWAQMFGRGRRG